MEGVDYSTSRPSPVGLYAAGKRFVIRYGGAGSANKWLTIGEAHALHAAGLSIVANVEGTERGLMGGHGVGAAWASQADNHFQGCDMPADRPIYLSADWDVQPDEWPTVANALRGAADAIGHDRVGIYGGRNAIRWARRDGVARWFWQTYAWSGVRTEWIPGNHIQQYHNRVPVAGGEVDLDRSLTVDFGQWPIPREAPLMTDINPATDPHLWRLAQRVEGLTKLLNPSNAGEAMPVVALLESLARKDDVALPALTAGNIAALAVALEPAIERAVENVLARTALVVRPKI